MALTSSLLVVASNTGASGTPAKSLSVNLSDFTEVDPSVPAAFMAETVNSTPAPLVRPVTMAEDSVPSAETDLPEFISLTKYEVIFEPPFSEVVNKLQETVALPIPPTTLGFAGDFG